MSDSIDGDEGKVTINGDGTVTKNLGYALTVRVPFEGATDENLEKQEEEPKQGVTSYGYNVHRIP